MSHDTLKCGLRTCNNVAEVFKLTHVTGDSLAIPCERGETWPKELTVGRAGGGVCTYTSGSFCCSWDDRETRAASPPGNARLMRQIWTDETSQREKSCKNVREGMKIKQHLWPCSALLFLHFLRQGLERKLVVGDAWHQRLHLLRTSFQLHTDGF